MWCFRVGIVALAWASAASASAQITPPPNFWARGTELSVVSGVANAGSTTGALIGGNARWDLTRWIAVEGRATWFDRGVNAAGFGTDLSGIVNLIAKRTVTPFVGAGFGLYRASFESSAAPMSDFYRGRMVSPVVGSTTVFTDPALRLAAGVDLVSESRRRHWTVRPEVSTLVVFANGRSESMLNGTVSVGYRFRGSVRGD